MDKITEVIEGQKFATDTHALIMQGQSDRAVVLFTAFPSVHKVGTCNVLAIVELDEDGSL